MIVGRSNWKAFLPVIFLASGISWNSRFAIRTRIVGDGGFN
jgi:hypothetical protein